MKDNPSIKDTRSFIIRTLLYVSVMVFLVCIVFLYYRKLYQVTRENIISKGRINAIESADQIDKRMSASMDTLKLASYTLDNMIRDRRTRQEILDYIVNETVAVGDSLIADTTGIYGYIYDEYMDGSGWDPGSDYVAVERPWYTEAMANAGKITIVDPYVDLDTGTIMVAIVKTLCDGKSVVGIDLSMNDFQQIVEDHVSGGRSTAEFIVNEKGIIISHSNRELIGTDLYNGTDPLSSSISELLHTSKTGYHYQNYDGHDYMIYAMPLENEWACVSVIDATDDFSQLLRPFIVTIITAVIILSAFIISLVQSERKSRMARALLLESEKATAASNAKTSFLSNMSHEIRTPVNAILGMNEMILREAAEESVIEYSENIKSAGNSLLGLINDVLDFSKIEAGKIEIIPVDYEIASVINDLVNMIHSKADEKGLVLNLDISPDIPRYMNGDEVRIKQIIANILTNAVKYTEKGSVTFHMGCTKNDDDPDLVILDVTVKDTGIGIKPEDLEKLFSKFERIEEKRNRNIEGTGLGMNITQSLLELMNSTLNVESTYGEGSTFSFSIRQKVINAEPLGDYGETCHKLLKERKKYRERFTAPDARVLVVDDNPMNLAVFKSLIKRTLIKTDTAASGDEGIALSRSKKYDIIFLDHMMPGKDGIETLRELREDESCPNRSTVAVCLTANAISGARETYMEAGFDDYLTKPIDADKLEEMMVHYLPEDLIKEPSPEEAATEDAATQGNAGPDGIPEEIAFLDGDLINVRAGLKNSRTLDIYMMVIKTFFESVDEHKDELEKLYLENDIKNYTIKVHSVKSSARIIGADGFGEDAQKLEDAGKSGDTQYIRDNHRAFIELYVRIKELLSPLFEKTGDEDTNRQVADRTLMDELYGEIRSSAESMDCDRLEGVFEDMKDLIIPESDRELYDKLKNAAGKYDYDTIISLLS